MLNYVHLDFTNPNVTLICSDKNIKLVWNLVHNEYDTIEEMTDEYVTQSDKTSLIAIKVWS